ncbi:MAG TPA: bifunctional 4-hydroxy-2-oxoglutarate aldolase/2-dehydro-3-deoxy-phosphogluconate aldolase [Terriglobales bacterium]|nr:bifunctional 4-hydroxy-2-oxoglutarate aldolase/2-dehydro-3-deoxy-phosphogluconate aldolase [Terriglobales bacterium]
MERLTTITKIKEVGIIPVVRSSSARQAIDAVRAIREGGIPVVEITMTVPGAVEVIREVVREFGSEVLVGAGTVLDPETARACMLAGAEFIVSPALSISTIEIARRYGKVVMPGALTPTEVVTAWQAGADFVKVFPCGAVGGAKYIKSLKAPLPQVELVPTGGVNLTTAPDFLTAGAAALGVGAELVDAEALKSGRFEIVKENAEKFAALVAATRNSAARKAHSA